MVGHCYCISTSVTHACGDDDETGVCCGRNICSIELPLIRQRVCSARNYAERYRLADANNLPHRLGCDRRLCCKDKILSHPNDCNSNPAGVLYESIHQLSSTA